MKRMITLICALSMLLTSLSSFAQSNSRQNELNQVMANFSKAIETSSKIDDEALAALQKIKEANYTESELMNFAVSNMSVEEANAFKNQIELAKADIASKGKNLTQEQVN